MQNSFLTISAMMHLIRNLSLLTVGAVSFSLAHANPTLVDQYLFNNNLNDSVGSNPVVNNGGATLGSGSLTFAKDGGPTLELNAGLATSYSIGLKFQLSLPNADGDPWTSIVNLSNLANDDLNQYLYLGNPYFYSIGSETDNHAALVPSDTVVDMIMTWDGTNYAAYLNGSLVDSFSQADAANAVVVGGKSIFWLFVDDGHGAESTNGILYQADVWNGALTPSEVANFDFLPVQQTVPDAGSLLPVWMGLLGVLEIARRRFARA
jgi:hypothetical protein